MKTIKEWLEAQKNRQFIPKITIGGKTTSAMRISDGQGFWFSTVVHHKNDPTSKFEVWEFSPDEIHVTCKLKTTSVENPPKFSFQINDLVRIEG